MMQISSVTGAGSLASVTAAQTSQQTESQTSFASVLEDALEQVNEVDQESNYASLDLLAGKTDDLSDTMITMEKAELAIQLTAAVRNKAVEAYKEIMNMQV